MSFSNTTVIEPSFTLEFICPHCSKETEKVTDMLSFRWVCKEHGNIYGFGGLEMFEYENSLNQRK